METWIPLISAIVGAGLALLGVFINNLFQAEQRKEDREEQRKEARIQEKKKWIERDILKVMDSIDEMLLLLRKSKDIFIYRNASLNQLKQAGLLTNDEYLEKIKVFAESSDELRLELLQKFDTIGKLEKSFGNELTTEYEKFAVALSVYLESTVEPIDKPYTEESDLWIDVKYSAGEFHKALRDKLISIRDTE